MSVPAHAVDGSVSLVSLLVELAADYPELDRHTVAKAVENAAATADVLFPGRLHHPRSQVEMLARDRLDATAMRRKSVDESPRGRVPSSTGTTCRSRRG